MQEFPRVLLVDMNSFFASVEQQANPQLRGKVVGVCASLHPTSCLIAASKEAKQLGIKTGTLVWQARKICPDIVLLVAEPEKYREVNKRINRIFYSYTDRVEVYSIDESFLDLSEYNPSPPPLNLRGGVNIKPPLNIRGGRGSYKNPLLIAAKIKRRIKSEVGEWLTCSVGIGENKFLAKLAASLQKPDGLSVIWREHLPTIYQDKKLSDLWGVSRGWERRLSKIGILSPLQLLNYPVQNLISLFGKPGFYLWQRVNGLEKDMISTDCSSPLTPTLPSGLTGEDGLKGRMRVVYDDPSPAPPMVGHPLPPACRTGRQGERENLKVPSPKSFGHSWVLNFRTTNKEKLKAVILHLAEKAARRMRAEGFQAYGFYLSIRLVDGTYIGKSKKLKFTINTGLKLYEQVMVLWKDWEFKSEVMHIAVGFRDLVEYSEQLELFEGSKRNAEFISASQARDSETSSGLRILTDCLDAINDKYGEFTIKAGLLARTSDVAPDAIAFGR